jgi:pyrroline-5-carboxylate reductase
MGGAILHGLLASGIAIDGGVRVSDQWSARVTELDGLPGVVGFDGAADPAANVKAVTGAKIVILAVKPNQLRDLLAEIGTGLGQETTVISIAAGVPTVAIEEALPDGTAVVRVMPNAPARVRNGVTGIAAGSHATSADLDRARLLFGTVGDVLVVPEDRIDALTSISGSGPAYVFYFIEKLTEAAIARGFDQADADLLVQGTFRGAVDLLVQTKETPEALRAQVTSPGGTTQAAVAVLESAGIGAVLDAATEAAVVRAAELARG